MKGALISILKTNIAILKYTHEYKENMGKYGGGEPGADY